MHSLRFLLQKIGLAFLLLVLHINCSRTSTDSNVTPDEACRVQTRTSTGPANKSLTTFTHDATGQLTSSLESFTYTSGIDTYRNDYQYDAAGFLTQKVYTYKSGNSELKTTTTYQYENGRLVKATDTGTYTNGTKTYTYDATGALTKYINELSSLTTTYLFKDGILTSAETVSDGKKYPATVVNGRITNELILDLGKGFLVYTRSDYNSAGQATRRYNTDAQGKENTTFPASTYEYTTQTLKDPSVIALKGHPTFLMHGVSAPLSRLTETYLPGYESRNRVVDYQYKTNSKGYLMEQTMNITGYQAGQAKTVITYSNCQ
ncbi:hypothetical protein GCM10027592_33550 [Spirosoma flavus]